MGKKFVVRLTESELAQMLAAQFMNTELKKYLGNLGVKSSTTDKKSSTDSSTLSSSDAIKSTTSGGFPELDLNTKEGYEAYKDIADKFISSRSSNLLGIKGSMLADAAKNTQSKTGTYVPAELALAQLAIEGGFSKNPNARPIRTKNPFNVGNVDSGKNVFHGSVQSGIQTYYDLMAKRYLAGGKSASDLLRNFVNVNGNRYATAKNYESSVSQIANQVKGMGEPIYASLKKSSTSDMA